MKSDTYALAVPADLLDELRRTANETGLSVSDAMRQSMWLGLPKLREQSKSNVARPLSPEEVERSFKSDPEWEALEAAMTNVPSSPPEA